jgi:hypothetical protein
MKSPRAVLAPLLTALFVLFGVPGGCPEPTPQTPQIAPDGSVFSYQGRLKEAAGPADGLYDFVFTLYDAAGMPIASLLPLEDVQVVDGIFSVTLDITGLSLTAIPRSVEIGVRPGASTDDFTVLGPRQELTAAPFAVGAAKVTDANVAYRHADQTWTGENVFEGSTDFVAPTDFIGPLLADGSVTLARPDYSVHAPQTPGTYAVRVRVQDPAAGYPALDVTSAGEAAAAKVDATNALSAAPALEVDSAGGMAADFAGDVAITGDLSATGEFDVAGGASLGGGAVTVDPIQQRVAVDGDMSVRGGLDLSNGSLNLNDGASLRVTGDLDVSGSAGFGAGQDTVIFSGGSAMIANALTAFGNLTVGNDVITDAHSVTGTLTVTGDVTIQNGTLDLAGSSLAVGDDLGVADNVVIGGDVSLGNQPANTATVNGTLRLDTDADGLVDVEFADGFLEAPDINSDGFPDFVRFAEATLEQAFSLDFLADSSVFDGFDVAVRDGSLTVADSASNTTLVVDVGASEVGWTLDSVASTFTYTISTPAEVAPFSFRFGLDNNSSTFTLGNDDLDIVKLHQLQARINDLNSQAAVIEAIQQGRADAIRAVIQNIGGGGPTAAVHAEALSPDPAVVAVRGVNHLPGGFAAFFEGNVQVIGDFFATSKFFRIDHPLDPANRYLVHACVESPEMKNIYDGVVTLDANGEAVVRLPDYFETLNADFRYQLTCIGGYAPVYIAEEVRHNAFKIAGGRPELKVSWQVTGVRHDPAAQENPIQVEPEKPVAERGRFLHAGYKGRAGR